MVAISNTTSLTFLKDELEATLAEAEQALEAFSEDRTQVAGLARCVEAFQQIRGITQMLELHGAVMLAEEMATATGQLAHSVAPERLIGDLSHGILLLERYLEYVQLKNRALPELLIEGVNRLRRACGKSLIPESHFFRVEASRPRQPQPPAPTLSREDIVQRTRRLRHLYQVGLLAVLRGDSRTGLRMMLDAMTRLDRHTGNLPLGRLWWLGQGVLTVLHADEMALTASRRQLLTLFDRAMKKLVHDGAGFLDQDAPSLLVKECVYLVSLSASNAPVVEEIRHAFAVQTLLLDRELQQELALMTGSSAQALRTVAEGLKEELAQAQTVLDLISQGAMDTRVSELVAVLERVAGTLLMVGQTGAAQHLRQRAGELAAQGDEILTPEHGAFATLVEDLLQVENAVALLERDTVPQDDIDRSVGNERISLYRLDEARRAVVSECRAGIALAKRSLSSWQDSQGDPMHLTNVPATLGTVAGGLTFLSLERARRVLEGCRQHVEQVLLQPGAVPHGPSLELLADAITAVDYYLESMEEHKPIGEAVLDVADQSLKELTGH